jgi:hypothetical protein
MRRHGCEVYVQVVDVYWHLAGHLCEVRVEERLVRAAHLSCIYKHAYLSLFGGIHIFVKFYVRACVILFSIIYTHTNTCPYLSDLLQRLNDPDLIVDAHNGHDGCVWSESGSNGLQVHQTAGQHGQVGDGETLGLQRTARVQHALVLGLRGDDVTFLVLVESEVCEY